MPITRLALLLVIVIAALTAPASADITLVNDGKTDYSIVLDTSASAAERHAAAELSSVIKQMSGAEMPVVEKDAPTHSIRLARDGRLDNEPFTLHADADSLVITGGGP